MIRVKFEYNADEQCATYTLMEDKVEYDEEFVVMLSLPFEKANSLARFFDEIILLSGDFAHKTLLRCLDNFVNSQQRF